MKPKITLDQWRALQAVVQYGGYAQAAGALHKSQSTISYAIQKLESLLGIKVLRLEGRKAVLTEAGALVLRRAEALLAEARQVEDAAALLAQGWEPEVRLAVETIFPRHLLLGALGDLAREVPTTRVEVFEHTLSGTEDALLTRSVDLAVAGHVPAGFVGDALLRMPFIAVASPAHPLHQLKRALTMRDLRQHRQLVVRDSGVERRRSAGWLGAEQRITVSQPTTSIAAVVAELGFAWLPEELMRSELAAGSLKPLPLTEGGTRYGELYLVFTDRDFAGPATRRLADLLRQQVALHCPPAAG